MRPVPIRDLLRWLSPIAAFCAVLLGGTSTAQASAFRKGPYLQNVTQDGVSILWQSSDKRAARIFVQAAGAASRTVDVPAGHFQEVRIGGFLPGQRVKYRVELAGESAEGEFSTAPTGNEPFSFIVFGDNRSNADAHRVLAERVRREVPDFILGTGDMVNEGYLESDWQIFFDVERELLRSNVLFPALGNHDRQGRNSAENYRKYFAVPADSPDPERYYAFTWGNSRFVVLDSNVWTFSLQDQTAWLERELSRAHAAPEIKHIFVTMHHPPFSVSIHGGHAELREMWTPLFEKYRVDAVFSGHDHCYSRGERMGVQYLVSGGAGAPLYPRDPRPAKEDAETIVTFERTYNYLRVHVVGDFVEFAAMRHDGTLIESLSWGTRDPALPTLASRQGPNSAPTVTQAVAAVGGSSVPLLQKDVPASVHAGEAQGAPSQKKRQGCAVSAAINAPCWPGSALIAAAFAWSLRANRRHAVFARANRRHRPA